jgi:hypothetical protein
MSCSRQVTSTFAQCRQHGIQLGLAEQPVLFTHFYDLLGILELAYVDRCHLVIQVDRQTNPALMNIRQRTKELTARQKSLPAELLVDAR